MLPCILAALQSISQMGDAAPPHVVGPDGGTIADGDAQARERRRAVDHINGINAAGNEFFGTPVGPAFPTGYVPNFDVGAAAPFNPANYFALWGRTTDRLGMSYMSELTRSVIASLSGFGSEVRGDGITDWYVPECYLDVESDFPGFVDRMFPHRDQWVQDTDEPCGNKTDCAHNFLHHLLPHVALRLAQRGMYFIKWAPSHPLSKAMLKVMGPGYEKWASRMRRKCDSEMTQHLLELGLKNNLGGTLCDISSSLGRLEKGQRSSRKRGSR